MTWEKRNRKWRAELKVDGRDAYLGMFAASARGEVDAALAYDAAARVSRLGLCRIVVLYDHAST